MLSAGRILVLAPHADDEVLGCGGFLWQTRHWKPRPELGLVLLTSSDVDIHQGEKELRTVKGETRIDEFGQVVKDLGAAGSWCDLETRALTQTLSALTQEIEWQIRHWEPDCVLFPWKSTHPDHTATYEAMMAALRPRNCPTVKTVLAYETLNYPWSDEADRFVPTSTSGSATGTLWSRCGSALTTRARGSTRLCGRSACGGCSSVAVLTSSLILRLSRLIPLARSTRRPSV